MEFQLSGIGTTLTGINFFVTILKMRAPGMTMFKMPVFTWASLCANVLIIASFPILTVTVALLTPIAIWAPISLPTIWVAT